MTAALQSLGQGEADRRLWTAAEVAVGCGLLGKNKHQRHLPFPYNSKPFPLARPLSQTHLPFSSLLHWCDTSDSSHPQRILFLPRHVENFPALFICGLRPLFPRKNKNLPPLSHTCALSCVARHLATFVHLNSQVWRESSKKIPADREESWTASRHALPSWEVPSF